MSQLCLPRPLMVLDQSIIERPANLLRAFVMAADLGGLDDKQAASAAGMDPATWSQFKTGRFGIKPTELDTYMDACGNELPLANWAFRRGYSLTPLESEMEKRLRIERQAREKAEAENALLKGLLVGRAA